MDSTIPKKYPGCRKYQHATKFCRHLAAEMSARALYEEAATTQHSNLVSASTSLRCRETGFCGAETRAPKRPLKSNR